MWWCMVYSGGSILWVRLGLRYRLLWFWVFGWPRGVGMVRKWKWYLLTDFWEEGLDCGKIGYDD